MKLKVVIINPPIRLTDKPRHIPHGLAILANIIRKKLGIAPVFIDINAHRYSDKKVQSILETMQFDVVLIGGLIPVYKRIIFYADMIKRINPKAIIIAGGSAAMSVPELLLRNSKVDCICAGEGEKVIIDILNGLENYALKELTHIKGFYFKIGDEILCSGKPDLLKKLDLESDIPAYDLLPMDIYLSNPSVGLGKDVDFISSRGCPFSCTFCYQPWGRRFRAHSPDFIIDALKYLKKRYRIDFLSFQDDEFLADRKRVYELCEKIGKHIPNLLWSCTGRANLVTDELVGAMKNAGCVSISYGFESGSQRILDSMNKKVTINDMQNAIMLNRKYGMMLPVSFMIGMPEEDEESCRETVEFCVRNNIPLRSMMFVTPYPGTQLFEDAVSGGRIERNKIHDFVMSLEDARDFTINLTDVFTDEGLILKRAEMIKNVCSRVKLESKEHYKAKVESLFGDLANDYFENEVLLKHRTEHGGMDIF
ncbi:MAG: radical SAM protein [Candidatus Omnitrophica bacterium]|nr:radical SAM protein [Candidatus Omnitrophota bacterium]